ncbi:hypothetical protein HZS_4928 [Henneguya salminicola]|nr:hypothetical protein HZS_4928 [Henneguya salminicola]
MRHLFDVFFSQGEIINSMTWDFFIDQIGQNIKNEPEEFLTLLIQFIKNMPENVKTFSSPNIIGLFQIINKHIRSYFHRNDSYESNTSDISSLFEILFVCLKFMRFIIQITTFSTPEGHEFNIISTESLEYAEFLALSFKFIINASIQYKMLNIIDELLTIFNIVCFSICAKSAIKTQFKKFINLAENESTINDLLFKLLQIIATTRFHKNDSWSSYIFSGAKKAVGILSLGVLSSDNNEKFISSVSSHSAFLFNHMVYCDFDHGSTARKFINFLSIQKDLIIFDNVEMDSKCFISNDNNVKALSYILKVIENIVHPSIKCDDLFEVFAIHLDVEIICLLFYSIIRDSPVIKSKFVESKYAEKMIINLSRLMYNSQILNHYYSCIVLIILLSLTNNQTLMEYLHVKNVSKVQWLVEQNRTDDWNVSNVALFCLLKGLRYNHFITRVCFFK